MMNINLICVGDVKQNFFKEAEAEYVKRLGKFCKINIVEVKTAPSSNITAEKQVQIESKNLEESSSGVMICFDRRGKELSSEDLAMLLKKLALNGKSEISFLIGGSYGLSQELLKKSEENISFGKITMPHTLFRIVSLEQIYRAFTILNNIAYHK